MYCASVHRLPVPVRSSGKGHALLLALSAGMVPKGLPNGSDKGAGARMSIKTFHERAGDGVAATVGHPCTRKVWRASSRTYINCR